MMRVVTSEEYPARFRPSRRLIQRALRNLESVIYEWDRDPNSLEFTMTAGLDWAFCTPLRSESCRGWCLYVSGKHESLGTTPEILQGNLRFTELVAQFIGSVRQVRLLQEQKTHLSTFFSPNVIENLTGTDALKALEPAERDVSVLFCDVRGFSRKSEAMAHELKTLLHSVREALGVMSNGILDHDGTIADFQGDAALGFWGWPVELADGPLPACRAALAICRGFRDGAISETSLLHDFSVGIGIVHGRAIAGQIGTAKQAKVGVFGPVVNQGSRLEGLTKYLDVNICVDETTAHWVQRMLPSSEARVRHVLRARPFGMNAAIDVYQLIGADAPDEAMDEAMIANFETALDAVIAGHWDEARELLQRVPDGDGPKRFLIGRMSAADYRPPDDWDGAFRLTYK